MMAFYRDYELVGIGATRLLAGADLGIKMAEALSSEGFTVSNVLTNTFSIKLTYMGKSMNIAAMKKAYDYEYSGMKCIAVPLTITNLSSTDTTLATLNNMEKLLVYIQNVRNHRVEIRFRVFHLKDGGAMLSFYVGTGTAWDTMAFCWMQVATLKDQISECALVLPTDVRSNPIYTASDQGIYFYTSSDASYLQLHSMPDPMLFMKPIFYRKSYYYSYIGYASWYLKNAYFVSPFYPLTEFVNSEKTTYTYLSNYLFELEDR